MHKPYIPKLIPPEDLACYDKSGYGADFEPGDHPAVLVVDMTRAFVEDRFPLGFSKTGEPAVRSINRLLESARAKDVPVVYTKGIPRRKPAERGRWTFKETNVQKENLREQEEAHEVVSAIAPMEKDIIITKAKPSAFFGTQLVSILNYFQIDTLIITGMVTSGCVRATVVDAFSYNYSVLIPIECVADRGQVSHEVNLFDMDMRYGNVIPLEEVLNYLAQITPAG